MMNFGLPEATGLYDPAFEHDACGVGFVANINGEKSHDIIAKGIEVLINLTHRGAVGSDPDTGDGAGLLFQIPDEFFREVCPASGITLPKGNYAVGMVFLPTDPDHLNSCLKIVGEAVGGEGLSLLGWRDVPCDPDKLGASARTTCPVIKQLFIDGSGFEQSLFEQKLYVLRRVIEKKIESEVQNIGGWFYISSLSSRTIVYKGLMLAHQVPDFYPDLGEDKLKSALVVVHQRYSTNTFPTWPLAQPFRFVAHNGEINTLRGNINNMRSRSASLTSETFSPDEIKKLLPVIIEGGSDSACFDNVHELLVMNGRSLAHSLMMMVPEAWGEKYFMGTDRRAFCEYHSMFMEPWDGPAALVSCDGDRICATLDRNGLRPSRYVITKQGMIVFASETGVLDIPPEDVKFKGRLSPGLVIVVDTKAGRVMHDDAVKAWICRRQPYRRWLLANRLELRGLFNSNTPVATNRATLTERQQAFGYTREDLEVLMLPMARDSIEPISSMGDDTPLAVLSNKPQLLFNYFKQLFAQVTNPPIDPIREHLVMSLKTYLGPQGCILSETPEHARMLKLTTPIMLSEDVDRIRMAKLAFRSVTLKMCFPEDQGADGLRPAIDNLCKEAERHAEDGCAVIILSDRNSSAELVPIPSLLATAAVNRHLIIKGLRTKVSILVESGEPREVMHFALLLGYGASAVNPYLALETVNSFWEDGLLPQEMDVYESIEYYIKAIEKGLLKIFSKMGISTLRSYRGAQIFEALGLSKSMVEQYFTATPSRINGIEIEDVAKEALMRHNLTYNPRRPGPRLLSSGGRFFLRRDGERHLWSPDAIRYLQQAVRKQDQEAYNYFAREINNQDEQYCTLRSLFDFTEGYGAPLDEVEPESEIVKRFVTGAMSFGSISREAHEAIAIAMNKIGGKSNSGEGGEDRARFELDENGNNRCSATKQVASGRFGVTTEYLINAKEIQIKISQGAKPGEGGQLPGYKVNLEIASVRNSTPGVSLISPPPHHDIYSIEDLSQLIFDLKNVNPAARINVKLVSEVGVGTVAAGVAKGHADAILISGGDGGTGASPTSSVKYAGIPWELGLSETQQVLVRNNLRGRVRLQADGQMRTGRDIAIAALLGAEEFGFATSALVCLGCVMMRKCHTNTCPVGIATQDSRLRKRFNGKPEHLLCYFHFIADDLRHIMAELGFRTIDEMVGRSDRLKIRDQINNWKAAKLDLNAIIYHPELSEKVALRKVEPQEHNLEDILDHELIQMAAPALEQRTPVEIDLPIRNVNRSVGAMLSGCIADRYGNDGLSEDTIKINFTGSAGQSFGAFGVQGITFTLSGDANDYVGKGLSGARIIVKPPIGSTFYPPKNVIVGNVALYGATGGEAYFNGQAGERFAIRNSGANAVVEGVGDHGCEYMTGGVVVILGRTGVNFAAGMSGGIAYVYDKVQKFDLRCNLDMVDLESISDPEDISTLRLMIENHVAYTNSVRGREFLDNWEETLSLFVKVIPMEYRRALGKMSKLEAGTRLRKEEVVENE